MGKYTELARDIVVHVGGRENITGLRHCITRLRFQLADESKADDDYLKNLEGVITVIKAMGEYMVVIGEHVPLVYKDVCKEIGFETAKAAPAKEEEAQKQNLARRFMNLIRGAMGPVLNLLCACGVIKGILTLAAICGLPTDSGVYALLNAAGDCFFFFMPLLLGYNAAKKLDMDPAFGFILAAAMCYPTIQGIDLNLFGYVVNATYTSTFLPVLFGMVFANILYKFFNKHIPGVFKGFGVPLLTLLISFPAAFIVIGPLANKLGDGINFVLAFLFTLSPILAAPILAGFWQIFILFGVHGVVVMFAFLDMMQGNPSQIMAIIQATTFAQIGTVLAIYLRTRNKQLKSVALPAFVSGLFGVTEPAIYGVTMPRMKMFIISCIGSACGGLVAGIAGVTMYSYTGMGFMCILGMINSDHPASVLTAILMVIVSFASAFVMAFVFFRDDKKQSEVVEKKEIKESFQEIIASPIMGKVIPLSESADEAFSSGALGQGVAIVPAEGRVAAPFDGVVRTLFPTKHAIGLVSDHGCELLIHVGIDTVRLEGEGFEACVKQGERVSLGQTLVTFDLERLKQKGYDVTAPILVTNSADYLDVSGLVNGNVNIGDDILRIKG